MKSDDMGGREWRKISVRVKDEHDDGQRRRNGKLFRSPLGWTLVPALSVGVRAPEHVECEEQPSE